MLHIVTVYDSQNYGSYFQARAMQWALEELDAADFVDIHHQSTLGQTLVSCLKKLLKGKWQSALLDYRKYVVFSNAKNAFPLVDIRQAKNLHSDFFIFGSDEIWNIHREKIKASKEFFGYGLPDERRIAVAPSVNVATLREFQENPYAAAELRKFRAIAVRDQHSRDVIQAVSGMPCALVSDPTLMFPQSAYQRLQTPVKAEGFILLYSYGHMFTANKTLRAQIIAFAKQKQLRLISVGRWFSFCDVCVAPTPGEFLSYVARADYVMTDTFHGLMFSLIYEKQFVAFPCGNTKVEEALDHFQLKNRLHGGQNSLEALTGEAIEYKKVTKAVREYGDATRAFIRQALESAEKQ